jgi:hypothetical protein
MMLNEDELEIAFLHEEHLESGEGEWLAWGGRSRFFI